MFPNVLPVEPEKREIKPYMVEVLFTTRGFFPMFEPPFQYGGGWSDAEDRTAGRVAVISAATNEKLFGGENSVGRKLRLGGEDYTVVGVLDEWHPTPRVYHISGGAFDDPQEIYVPFAIGIERELVSTSNNSCCKDSGTGYQGLLDSECIWMDFWVQVEGRRRTPSATSPSSTTTWTSRRSSAASRARSTTSCAPCPNGWSRSAWSAATRAPRYGSPSPSSRCA